MKMKVRIALFGLMSGLLLLGSASAQSPFPVVGLTAYYPLDGNTLDASGNGRHGTANNGALPTSDRFGSPDGAYFFDGINDNISIGGGLISPNALTIALWFKQAAVPTFTKWRDLVAGNCGSAYLTLDYYQNRPAFGGQCDAPFGMTNTAQLADTNWHHVVATYGSGQVRIYFDGVLVATSNRNGNFNAGLPLFIGAATASGAEAFHGSIDDVYIYNRALTLSEVEQLAAVTAPPTDADGDGVNDEDDLCPTTAAGATVDANGCADDDVDMDGDGICDLAGIGSGPSGCTGSDNCPLVANNSQDDADMDGVGDACDSDDDNDGVADGSDNCPLTLGGDADQTDTDMDGAGDICDADLDGDGVNNTGDVCPNDPDPDQTDTDGDLAGDACDINDDGDDYDDVDDNCPLDVNNGQEDLDGDNIGDVCDADLDGDGVNNNADNCPVTLGGDANQTDTDLDSEGDVCDTDDDNDTILDGADNCPLAANTSQGDADMDGIGDACNDANDADGDEWSDALDNCPNDANGDQADLDGDLIGDACDLDVDGDGVDNGADNCAATPLGELSDASGCTIEQLSPCDGPQGTTSSWKNHGKYVSSVAHAANDFRDAGLISDAEHGDIVSAASQSSCGNRN